MSRGTSSNIQMGHTPRMRNPDDRSFGGGNAGPRCQACPLRWDHGFEPLTEAAARSVALYRLSHDRAWAGTTIVNQGQGSPRLFTLFSGWAAQYRRERSGGRYLLEILLPGDLAGLDAVYGSSRAATVTALPDVTFCTFSTVRPHDIRQSPDLSQNLMTVLSNALARAERRASAIASGDARGNLTNFLLELHERLVRRNLIRSGSYKSPLALRHLADATGLAKGHVHRTLQSLERDQILSFRKGMVVFLDLERAQEIGLGSDANLRVEPLL